MLRHLFGRLTNAPARGEALFARVVTEARKPHWYEAGQVPDTLDGRFAALATICAMVIVQLEKGGEQSEHASVAVTERFVEAMDSEHRELGINDPGLGRRVRKLLASLERRVDEWRAATAGERDWNETVETSLYRSQAAADPALAHSAGSLRDLWERLGAASEAKLIKGDF
jgi:cytochrome b pre-mRNA-processing protein 3